MGGDGLNDRGRALEEAFFAKQNEVLRRKLHEASDGRAKREAFAAASGVTDDAVLDRLTALGIGADTLVALSLVPLVLVAWADGGIDARERRAVLAAAEEGGMGQDSAGHILLDGWLEKRPEPDLLATWKGYVAAISPSLGGDARAALQRELLGRARIVAEATGGLLGFGRRVSAAEEAVLRDLGAAFA